MEKKRSSQQQKKQLSNSPQKSGNNPKMLAKTAPKQPQEKYPLKQLQICCRRKSTQRSPTEPFNQLSKSAQELLQKSLQTALQNHQRNSAQ
jgi:hypothetical protein